MSKLGDDFFLGTKYVRGKLPAHQLDWDTKPPVYKEYPSSLKVTLPPPTTDSGPRLWDMIAQRRSVRAYSTDEISKNELSQLIWATQGVTGVISDYQLRAAPSAGALYPIETYLLVNRVSGIDAGLYHYPVKRHELELLKEGDYSLEVKAGALDQSIAQRAAVVFIWSALFPRSKWKYLQRAYRYVFLDAGHIAQNLALASEALGLGSCQIGAIYDDELNQLLDLDGVNESVIYLSSVGKSIRQSDL